MTANRSTLWIVALALTIPAASSAAGWSPRSAAPTPTAKRILDSLPDPRRVPIPDEIRRASEAGGATVPPSSAPVPRNASAPATGSCLEVQLAATADEGRAAAWARDASESLITETRIVAGGGLFRVRAGGCLERVSADALVARARAAGWTGAFVVPAR